MTDPEDGLGRLVDFLLFPLNKMAALNKSLLYFSLLPACLICLQNIEGRIHKFRHAKTRAPTVSTVVTKSGYDEGGLTQNYEFVFGSKIIIIKLCLNNKSVFVICYKK